MHPMRLSHLVNEDKKEATVMTEPFDGIKVIEVARALQGPIASEYLADMGADVIKVEGALGDPNRLVSSMDRLAEGGFGTQFISANRGKRSLWLDLRSESSLEIVRRLIDNADVFVSNYMERSLIEMGLGYDQRRDRNEDLIYGLVNGYGPQGPDADKRMLDGSAGARGGFYSVNGPSDGPPVMPGTTFADLAGAMQFALGITTALAARARHGGGQRVDVSALGAQLFLQKWELDTVSLTDKPLTREGSHMASVAGTYGLYETSDGAIMIAFMQDESTWAAFCMFAGLDELILDERFDSAAKRAVPRLTGEDSERTLSETANEIRPYLEKAFKGKTTAEWAEFLQGRPEVVWDVVQDYDQVLSDPQVLANDYIIEQEIPTFGKHRLVGNLVHINGTTGPTKSPPPSLGQHNEEILSSLGFEPIEIQQITADARAALVKRLGIDDV